MKEPQTFFLSREQARELDRRASTEYALPSLLLMENAGRGVAELLVRLGVHGPVVLVCGKGNNGGDGFVAARHLELQGAAVQVFLFGRPEELPADAAVNYRILERSGIPLWRCPTGSPEDLTALAQALKRAEWVVDALFGTGLKGPLGEPFAQVVAQINASPCRVLAVDIPSGLDCDTGQPLGPTIRAHHTATFVALKKGYLVPAARAWLGQVHVIDIGLPRALLTRTFQML
jgi:NAD(P)H-hydrate epimerase